LRARDPELLRRVDQAVAAQAAAQSGVTLDTSELPPPPMLTPVRLRELVIPNRVVVSAMGGDVAIGDAGLVLAGPTGGSTAAEWKRLVEFVHGESSAKI